MKYELVNMVYKSFHGTYLKRSKSPTRFCFHGPIKRTCCFGIILEALDAEDVPNLSLDIVKWDIDLKYVVLL